LLILTLLNGRKKSQISHPIFLWRKCLSFIRTFWWFSLSIIVEQKDIDSFEKYCWEYIEFLEDYKRPTSVTGISTFAFCNKIVSNLPMRDWWIEHQVEFHPELKCLMNIVFLFGYELLHMKQISELFALLHQSISWNRLEHSIVHMKLIFSA
jgi:hypothetical protein